MPAFAKFKVEYPNAATPTHTFYFLAPKGSYTGIETEAGISELLPTDDEINMPVCDVAELVASGIVERRHLRINVTGNRDKYAKVVIAKHMSLTFDAAVTGDAFRGGTIKGVVTRQRASYS
jgi:hypothetical protein